MKKVFSILLAVTLLCMMAIPALADEPTGEPTGKYITVTGATGHTYNVYQIFTGDVSINERGKPVLSNVKYGQNAGTEGQSVSDTLLKAYMAMDGTVLAKILFNELINKDNPVGQLNEGNDWTLENLATGYYLIDDTTAVLPDGDTRSPQILKVVEDVTVASKHAGLTFDKKVKDSNDSLGTVTGWQDSADYDFGDAVPFKLSATLPTTFNHYSTYELTFHDKQALGFGAPANVKVYIADSTGQQVGSVLTKDTDYTVSMGPCANAATTCEFGNDCSFTVKIKDLKKNITQYVEGYQVVVEYTAVLNNTATVGEIGNENTAYVCHPDGHTPQDTVVVLTYELTANKIDGATGTALTGAGFTLYKWDASVAAEDKWVAVGEEVKGDTTTEFTWSGIDDGKYKLVETTTPAGYNTIAPLELEITALHKAVWTKGTDELAFESVSTKGTIFHDLANGDIDGKLEGDIENNKGTVLPETGAFGTMMFVTVGTILVMVAVVFMVSRKKMSIYED